MVYTYIEPITKSNHKKKKITKTNHFPRIFRFDGKK